MIDPIKVWNLFFDDDGQLRIDATGKPVLDHAKKLYAFGENLPHNQLPNVTKIFSLFPFKAGLLFAGIAGIGDKSIRCLVETFLKVLSDENLNAANEMTIRELGDALLAFLASQFEECFATVSQGHRPEMEILLSGYSPASRTPEIFRLVLGPRNEIVLEIIEGNYDIVYGGQYDVIQRIVSGVDFQGYCNIQAKHERLMVHYHEKTQQWLRENGHDVEIPLPKFDGSEGRIFNDDFGGVRGIFSDIRSLSEQAGINFVEFLIATMINAQDFSDRIPTVGGQIHVAIITPSQGFKWISKEEFKFQNHSVPRYE